MDNNRVVHVVLLCCVVGVLGWYLYQPVPPGCTSPWTVSKISLIFKLQYDVSWLVGGLSSRWPDYNTFRYLTNETGVDDARIQTMEFDGVKVRVYNYKTSDPRPALVFYHGGGWTVLSPQNYDRVLLDVVSQLDILVVSVHYRLAGGQIRYPIPAKDCLVATKYLINNAAALHVDPAKVVVGGNSAGGNLAASVSLQLRDSGFQPMPVAQVLIYPALQAVDFNLPSYLQNPSGPILTRHMMGWFLSVYATGTGDYGPYMTTHQHVSREVESRLSVTFLNHDQLDEKYKYSPYNQPEPPQTRLEKAPFGSEDEWARLGRVVVDPYFAPLMADNLTGLPATYMYTAQADPLRDEGLLYARRLQQAGVPVTHIHGDNAFHCTFGMDFLDEGRYAAQTVKDFLKNMWHLSESEVH